MITGAYIYLTAYL